MEDINVFVNQDTPAANVKVSIISRDFFQKYFKKMYIGTFYMESIFYLPFIMSLLNLTELFAVIFRKRFKMERKMRRNMLNILCCSA